MSRRTVLVIEDDPKLRFILEEQLIADFDVITAESAEAALTELQTFTPDLVLLNILLPGMDGIELCRSIRAHERLASVPVIFLTGRIDAKSRERCLAVGANDYITKPWQGPDLIQRISEVIGLARP